MNYRIYIALFIVMVCQGLVFGQERKDCGATKYVDYNQVTNEALEISRIKGRIVADDNDDVLDGLCVVLFDETDKKIVAYVTPDRKGKFRFGKVPEGRYRLVVIQEFNAYCAANVLIVTGKSHSKGASIVVVMKPAAIDDCSYGHLAY